MEKVIDELVAQGYEVSGSDSSVRVKIGALTGQAVIRKSAYSNTFVISTHTWVQLLSLTLLLSSVLSSLLSQWGQVEASWSMWFSIVISIPIIIAGFISVIISEIQLQPIRKVVRLANSKLSRPVV